MARYRDPAGRAPGRPGASARPAAGGRPLPVTRRERRRWPTALLAIVLLIAVPIVSAYVAYKLTAGESPFEWPPTVDYDTIFGK